jgi:5'-methylthioadenosine phosphorylase
MAMVTDYDCWHESEGPVTVEMIIANLRKNAGTAQEIIRLAARAIDPDVDCDCRHALANAIMTPPVTMKPATRKKLNLLIGKYLKRR